MNTQETKKQEQLQKTKEILQKIRNNEAPSDLVVLIAKQLRLSNADAKPKPTNNKDRYAINKKLYYILDEETANEYAFDIAASQVDDYLKSNIREGEVKKIKLYIDKKQMIADEILKNGRYYYLSDYGEMKIEYQGALLYFYRLE